MGLNYFQNLFQNMMQSNNILLFIGFFIRWIFLFFIFKLNMHLADHYTDKRKQKLIVDLIAFK